MTARPGRSDAGFWAAIGLAEAGALALTAAACRSMGGGMPMPGGWTMSMMWMRMAGQSWPGAAAMFLGMWTPMMVAMMLPSAVPMLRNFRRFRDPRGRAAPGWATLAMATGYFVTWTVAGLGVWVVGVGWGAVTMASAPLSRAVPFLTGLALVAAGGWQFVPGKTAGLDECRDPRACCVIGRKVGLGRCFTHGLHRGVSCGVCCVGPMLAMVALGAMTPWVMAAAGAWIATEKLAPEGLARPAVVGWAAASALAGLALMAAAIYSVSQNPSIALR